MYLVVADRMKTVFLHEDTPKTKIEEDFRDDLVQISYLKTNLRSTIRQMIHW